MAKLSALYTLTAPDASFVRFNDGTFGHGSLDNLYWIDALHGLDGPTLRVPTDDVPFGHGGIAHRSWKGPRHPIIEGRIIIQSAEGSACEDLLDEMEAALRLLLDKMLAPNTGGLSWTDSVGDHNLGVVYERGVDFQPADNFRTRHFDFGLFSESADL